MIILAAISNRVGRSFGTTSLKVLGNCSHLQNLEVSCISPSVNQSQKVKVWRFSLCRLFLPISDLYFFPPFFHYFTIQSRALRGPLRREALGTCLLCL